MPRRASVCVLVYRLSPRGRVLVRVEILEHIPCKACDDSGRYRACGKAVPVTVACPFCRRFRP